MRSGITCLLVGLGACGCSPTPTIYPVAESTQEAFPTPEQLSRWAISRDVAIRIAHERMGTTADRHLILHASPIVRGTEQYWSIGASSAIAGGWHVDVDALTGAVLRSRALPGR